MNSCIRYTKIVTYAYKDTLTTSTVTFVKGISYMEKDTGEPMSIHQMPMMIVIFTLLLKLILLLLLVNPKLRN
jgi:hypothetical protein